MTLGLSQWRWPGRCAARFGLAAVLAAGGGPAVTELALVSSCDQDPAPLRAPDQLESEPLRAVLDAWRRFAGSAQEKPQGVQQTETGGLVGGVLAMAVHRSDAAAAACTVFASNAEGAEVSLSPASQMSADRMEQALTAWARAGQAPDEVSAIVHALSKLTPNDDLTLSEVRGDDGVIRLRGVTFQDPARGEVVVIFARAVAMSR